MPSSMILMLQPDDGAFLGMAQDFEKSRFLFPVRLLRSYYGTGNGQAGTVSE